MTNACLYAFNNALVVQKQASFVSMDADGFTVNFTQHHERRPEPRRLSRPERRLREGGLLQQEHDFVRARLRGWSARVAGPRRVERGVDHASRRQHHRQSHRGELRLRLQRPRSARCRRSRTTRATPTASPWARPTGPGGAADRDVHVLREQHHGGAGRRSRSRSPSAGRSGASFEMYAVEYSGVARSSPVDQTSAAFRHGATPRSSGAKTTTSPDELIYGFCMFQASGTPNPRRARGGTRRRQLRRRPDRLLHGLLRGHRHHGGATQTGAARW